MRKVNAMKSKGVRNNVLVIDNSRVRVEAAFEFAPVDL
jgi:hypothetical protein